MPSVNSEIRKILKEKESGMLSGVKSMKEMLKELQQQVLSELGKAAITSWDAYYLRQLLDSIEFQISNFTEKIKANAAGLMETSWGLGQNLVDLPLKTTGMYSGFHVSTSALDALKDFTFHKIDGLSSDAWIKIKGELNIGVLGGKTPQEVASAIGKNLTDPGIFRNVAERAEAITKTEMGRVFSKATQLRMEQAAEHVDGLEKQWRHAGHPIKARPTHLAAHGQHVPVNSPFIIGGTEMMFPRDPAAPLEETINCGCDHVPYHARWA